MKTYYRRRLPHYQPAHGTFFVTFRLEGSLPAKAIAKLKQDRAAFEQTLSGKYGPNEVKEKLRQSRALYFGKFDALLDGTVKGNRWLADARVADLVAEALRYRDNKEYTLLAYCIMPNHVHMLISDVVMQTAGDYQARGSTGIKRQHLSSISDEPGTMREGAALYSVLQRLKSFTAVKANKLIGRSGAFWLHESYDHVIRDDLELGRVVRYIANNPVKAGLVSAWNSWPWTYLKDAQVLRPGSQVR